MVSILMDQVYKQFQTRKQSKSNTLKSYLMSNYNIKLASIGDQAIHKMKHYLCSCRLNKE
jgi:hypothetical protein